MANNAIVDHTGTTCLYCGLTKCCHTLIHPPIPAWQANVWVKSDAADQ